MYWKPVYNLLEHEFELIVANARHIKAVPGRKTDVKDAEWIADLLRHGLLRPSFIPERPERELRELVRYRRGLIRDKTQIANRMHQVLEGGNIKLASVATDILGVSGRDMLRAMIAGEDDPNVLAEMARGRLRNKLGELRWALEGTMGDHQRFMLSAQLRLLEVLETEVELLNEEVERRLAPLEEAIERLDGIPGVARRVAEDVLAEIGADMSRFPSARHLASWAKLSPGNYESAGKRRSGLHRTGQSVVERRSGGGCTGSGAYQGHLPFSAIPQDSISKGPKACHRSACPQDVEDHLPHASRWDHVSRVGERLLRSEG